MDKYNLVKLRTYVIHLAVGLFLILFGGSVLYAVVSEMRLAYDVPSRIAYISGITAAVLITLFGIWYWIRGVAFDQKLFKKLSFLDRERFLTEIEQETAQTFGTSVFVTESFVMINLKSWDPHSVIIRLEDLTGCFGDNKVSKEVETPRYKLDLFDRRFRHYTCVSKDKGAQDLEAAVQQIRQRAPWAEAESQEAFLKKIRSSKTRQAMLSEQAMQRERLTTQPLPDLPAEMAAVQNAYKAAAQKQEMTAVQVPEVQAAPVVKEEPVVKEAPALKETSALKEASAFARVKNQAAKKLPNILSRFRS